MYNSCIKQGRQTTFMFVSNDVNACKFMLCFITEFTCGQDFWPQYIFIETSEKVFYRQVLEIYATSVDYSPKAQTSIEFFKKVQNKIHFAVHGQVSKSVFIYLPFPYLVSIDKSQSIIGFLPGDWSRIRANNSAAFSSDKPSSRIHLMMKAAMPADWNS